ncbi:MAG: sensor domain-containing diguanylate cyclase [Deltaproteobacteria bacterium]|nr:sensor domain-containing diguanylate cyclase [Deltaproteobacteria bacterium]
MARTLRLEEKTHYPAWVSTRLDLLDGLFDGAILVGADHLICFWNRGAERITGFRAAEVLGRDCREVLRHLDYRSIPLCPQETCPVQCADHEPGMMREGLVYIAHSRGHRVPVIGRATVVEGPEGFRGVLQIFSDSRVGVVHHRHLVELRRLALFDALTGMGNRRYGEAALSLRIQERDEQGRAFGVLLADIDHFKAVNDSSGHDAGDEVLRSVGRLLAGGLRTADAAVRWGGEEFLFVLSDVGPEALAMIAEKLRREVEELRIPWRDGCLDVTLSVGGCIARPEEPREVLLQRADQALYASKRGGRNRVTIG